MYGGAKLPESKISWFLKKWMNIPLKASLEYRIHEKEYVIKGTETKYIIPLINI